MLSRWRFVVSRALILLGLVATSVIAARARAQEPVVATVTTEDPLGGIDIMVLVDNSGSMFHEYNEKLEIVREGGGSDPDGLRFEAVRYLVSQLTYDNLFEWPGREHRLGVVTFGSSANTRADVPLTSLRTIDLGQREDVERSISEALRRQNLGDTDFRAAFSRAAAAFGTPLQDSRPRTRAVIVLTDGDPMVPSVSTDAGPVTYWLDDERTKLNPQFMSAYMGVLAGEVAAKFPRASAPRATDGYHLWVVFLGRHAPASSGAWQRIVGADHWRLVSSAQQIAPTFNEILGTIYDPGLVIPEDFCVPPYVAEAAFSVFGLTPLREPDDVIFTRSDGSRVHPNDPDVILYRELGTGIRRLEIRRPAPGQWHYATKPGTRVQVRFDPVFGKPAILSPAGPQALLSETPVRVALNDYQGNPLAESPGFPLMLEASMASPSASTPTALHFSSVGNGVYVSQEKLSFREEGPYTLTLAASARGCSGEEVVLISPTTYTIPVGRPSGRLLDPACTGGSCQPFRRVTFRFELVGPNGNQVSIPAGQGVRVTLATADDVQPVEMTRTDDGRYECTLFVASGPFAPRRLVAQASLRKEGREEVLCRAEQVVAPLFSTLECANWTPRASENVDADTQSVIGFDLLVSGGPFVPDPSFPIDFGQSFAVAPSGEKRPLSGIRMVRAGRFEQEFVFDEPGLWRIHIAGTVIGPEGTVLDAFAPSEWTVEAAETIPLCLRIESPPNEATIEYSSLPSLRNAWLRARAPARPITFRFRVETMPRPGAPASSAAWGFLRPGARPQDTYAVSLIGPGKEEYGRKVELAVDPEEPSVVVGTMAAPHPSGRYELRVNWKEGADQQLSRPHVVGATCTTTAVQIELRVNPLHTAATIALGWVLPLALGVTLLCVLGREVINRMGHMGGTLWLTDLSDPARRYEVHINYDRRWHTAKLDGWPRQHGIRKLKITSLGEGHIWLRVCGRPRAEEKELSRRSPEMLVAERKVRITYQPPTAAPDGRTSAALGRRRR